MFNGKRVLITGINGYIGTNLTGYIADAFPLAVVEGIDFNGKSDRATVHFVDMLDSDSVSKVIKKVKPDYVFHLAGVIYSKNWSELFRGNVETTINLLEAVSEYAEPVRVLVPGSAAEYGLVSSEDLPVVEEHLPNPLKPYGVSKVWQTTVTRNFASFGADAVIGRIFNVIGGGLPDTSSIGSFADQIKSIRRGTSPARIVVGNITTKRDFLDIRDICSALVRVAAYGRRGEIYNISSGASVSMEHILALMCKQAGISVDVVVDPLRVSGDDIPDIFGSNSKLVKECGWQMTIPMSRSIKELFE